MNNVIESALSLYDGIMRRDREEYRNHPERMAKIAEEMGWLNSSSHLLIALHDVLEVGVEVRPSYLEKVFALTPEEMEVITILTRRNGERSQEHYERVLNSGNLIALQIKYCDNIDNAHMEYEDIQWYKEVARCNYSEESDKYRLRSRQVFEKIKEILFK